MSGPPTTSSSRLSGDAGSTDDLPAADRRVADRQPRRPRRRRPDRASPNCSRASLHPRRGPPRGPARTSGRRPTSSSWSRRPRRHELIGALLADDHHDPDVERASSSEPSPATRVPRSRPSTEKLPDWNREGPARDPPRPRPRRKSGSIDVLGAWQTPFAEIEPRVRRDHRTRLRRPGGGPGERSPRPT